MNKYESVIILQEKLTDEEINNIINKIEKLIKENAELIKTTDFGTKKQLAYTIKGNDYGFYVEFDFKANEDFISELERIYRITDEIIKFITIIKEEE